MQYEIGGKIYSSQSEAFAAIYETMREAGETDGRTTREVANDLGSRFFGWNPKSKDAFSVKVFASIVAAIDRKRLDEFPCYIPTPALEAIEARGKATARQFKGDRSEWSRAMKREANLQVAFAGLLHVGKTAEEATEKHA